MNGAPFTLTEFVRESNRIEGIHREPTTKEIEATAAFLDLPAIVISDIVKLVAAFQPGARPRFVQGLNVQVGAHVPPRGGPHIQSELQKLINLIDNDDLSPYEGHVRYEKLHPFTDGNGRSGRAVWLWQMGGIERAPLGFLHHFYYQTLQNSR